MTRMDIVTVLTEIIEKQSLIIRKQAEALAQVDAMCVEEEIGEVDEMINHYLN